MGVDASVEGLIKGGVTPLRTYGTIFAHAVEVPGTLSFKFYQDEDFRGQIEKQLVPIRDYCEDQDYHITKGVLVFPDSGKDEFQKVMTWRIDRGSSGAPVDVEFFAKPSKLVKRAEGMPMEPAPAWEVKIKFTEVQEPAQ